MNNEASMNVNNGMACLCYFEGMQKEWGMIDMQRMALQEYKYCESQALYVCNSPASLFGDKNYYVVAICSLMAR
jgi:hypothetical protein